MGNWSSKQTVPCLDLNRYQGTWIEVAKFTEGDLVPNFKTIFYKTNLDGKSMEVTETTEDTLSIKGNIIQINDCYPGRLFISFPIQSGKIYTLYDRNIGNYWVLYTDYDNYAIVSTPDEKCLWILSRKESNTYQSINNLKYILLKRGYVLDKLIINTKTFI